VGSFRWLGPDAIPAVYDLRRCGWTLVASAAAEHVDATGTISLLAAEAEVAHSVVPPLGRRITLVVGVADALRRAALLRDGFGDVLGADAALDELEARATRTLANAQCEPRRRTHGELELLLLARDGFVSGKAVGLHPREFALLWRLMAEAGGTVAKACLLAEVWNLNHVPETNSLPVHVSRLRRKLEVAGFAGLIATRSEGYAYVPPPGRGAAIPLTPDRAGLDAYARMADDDDRMEAWGQ